MNTLAVNAKSNDIIAITTALKTLKTASEETKSLAFSAIYGLEKVLNNSIKDIADWVNSDRIDLGSGWTLLLEEDSKAGEVADFFGWAKPKSTKIATVTDGNGEIAYSAICDF